MTKQRTAAKRPSISPTRVQGLGYTNHRPGHWQFIHEGAPIGRVYQTRTELLADVERVASARGFIVEPTVASLTLERFAAVRKFNAATKEISTVDEYIDLSTLSDTAEGARALAEQRDHQNTREIRAKRALPFLRVARVRIAEVR